MNKIIKVLVPIATIAIPAILLKGKIGRVPTNSVADVANDVVSGIANNSEKVFGGLTQSMLDGLAKETSRGVKAIIEGDTLKYYYKSASGKNVGLVPFVFDEAGKIVGYFGNGGPFKPNSPRFFIEKVIKAMQEIK